MEQANLLKWKFEFQVVLSLRVFKYKRPFEAASSLYNVLDEAILHLSH